MSDYHVMSYGVDDPLHAMDRLTVELFGDGQQVRYVLIGAAATSMAKALEDRKQQPFGSRAEFTDLAKALGLQVQGG